MEFCPDCGELLTVATEPKDPEEAKDQLFYSCIRCDTRHKAKKRDYKLFEEDFTKPRNFESLLKYACDNITVPRQYKKCPKCKKEEIVAVLRMPHSMKGIYICCKCKNYWE